MKTFACGAVVPGCAATFEGDSEEEILQQVAAHAREEHGMEEVPDELVETVRTKIQTV